VCEELGVKANAGRGKICCRGGVGKYYCMDGASKYCCTGGTGKSCCARIVLYCIPDGAAVIMCALPHCPEDEFTNGNQNDDVHLHNENTPIPIPA
jgi:hypothetical protein